jgi:hypothetical protein
MVSPRLGPRVLLGAVDVAGVLGVEEHEDLRVPAETIVDEGGGVAGDVHQPGKRLKKDKTCIEVDSSVSVQEGQPDKI